MSEYLNEPDSDNDSINEKDSKVYSEEEIKEGKDKSLAFKEEGNQSFSQGNII